MVVKYWLGIFAILLGLLVGCGEETKPREKEAMPDFKPKKVLSQGELLMEKHCGSCHMVPQASDLDTTTWKYYVLVRMASYMGVFWDTRQYYDSLPAKWLEPGEGGERVLKEGIYPPEPTISRADFETIVAHIMDHAPAKLPGPKGIGLINSENPRFRARAMRLGPEYEALTTGVAISPEEKVMYVSLYMQDLMKVSPAGKIMDKTGSFKGAVHISREKNRISVADIGDMFGADTPKGVFASARSFEGLRRGNFSVKFEHLQRPVHATYADLNGDGAEDIVLAEYGNQIGQLTWRKNLGLGKWEKKVLFSDDGTLKAYVHDFTGDGRPDIIAHMANADESIYLFKNEGEDRFSAERLFRFNPTWGSTSMELVDFDQDGLMDIVVANGDNADYPAILKPHHGIRLYVNQGGGKFKEKFYLPMNGAYGTRCRDFDLDGDMDIAAVSFYPDFTQGHKEAFVYFENQGNFEFSSYGIPDYNLGRWMVLDAGDVDGDGDEDIVLGAFNVKSSEVPAEVHAFWTQQNVPVLLLENLTK